MAFDVITPQNMGRQEIALTVGTVFTVPSDQRAILKSVDLANGNASPVRISVYLVESGGSSGSGNALLNNIEVPGYGAVQWTGAQVMNEGDTIQAVSNTADTTIICSGGGCI